MTYNMTKVSDLKTQNLINIHSNNPSNNPSLKKPGLLVLDVDATLIEEEVIDLLGDIAGVGCDLADITSKAMQGKMDFNTSLKLRVSMLKGLDYSCVKQVAQNIHVTNGAKKLISTLHSFGWKVGAVSGGFKQVLDDFLPKLNIDFWVANNLEVVDSKLSGKVIDPIVNRQYKAKALTNWASKNNIDIAQSVAIGDGANDIDMIKTAGLGVAFCAKQLLKSQAKASIDTRDLSLVLDLLS